MSSAIEQTPSPSTQPSAPLAVTNSLKDGKTHLLLAASGSVATIKLPNIISSLSHHRTLSIRIVLTSSAAEFLQGQSPEQPSLHSLSALPNVDGVYLDDDEWKEKWVRGGKILHIELRRWADLLVVAPLSANTMAKIVGGLCDNLLLSTIRAWDTTGELDATVSGATVSGAAEGEPAQRAVAAKKNKIILLAPAMNTAMWRHPVTRQHMKLLEGEWSVERGGWMQVLRPVEKELACGDTGDGAMRDWREIVGAIEERMELNTGPKC